MAEFNRSSRSSNTSSHDLDEQINKKDLEIIFEVNRKVVEIEAGVADQNEEIISLLTIIKDKQEEINEKAIKKVDKIIEQNDGINKDIFKLQVLFITGLLSLVVQVIQIFLHH